MLGERLLTASEVAALFNRRPRWFYEHRHALERRGFPKPVIHGAYDPEAIKAWRRSQMSPTLRALLREPAADATVQDERSAEEWAARADRVARKLKRGAV
jgi:hypothetical protein